MLTAAALILGFCLGVLVQESFDLLFSLDLWLRRVGERIRRLWPWAR